MQKLYEQNVKIVYHFLLFKCHDSKIAEDLTPETFLQAYKSLDGFKGECKISVWLCQIAKHLWYQYLQKNKHELPLEIAENETVSKIDLETQVMTKLDLLTVLKEMHKLPPQIREVMYLRMSADLSFKDIGPFVYHQLLAITLFELGIFIATILISAKTANSHSLLLSLSIAGSCLPLTINSLLRGVVVNATLFCKA